MNHALRRFKFGQACTCESDCACGPDTERDPEANYRAQADYAAGFADRYQEHVNVLIDAGLATQVHDEITLKTADATLYEAAAARVFGCPTGVTRPEPAEDRTLRSIEAPEPLGGNAAFERGLVRAVVVGAALLLVGLVVAAVLSSCQSEPVLPRTPAERASYCDVIAMRRAQVDRFPGTTADREAFHAQLDAWAEQGHCPHVVRDVGDFE